MVIRQLTEHQYKTLHNALIMKAHTEPLEASYTVPLTVNGVEYLLKIQPERHNKFVILQALRVYREEHGPNFELITSGNILSSLLELFIYL